MHVYEPDVSCAYDVVRLERSRTITVPGTLTDLATYLGVNRCALSRVIGQLSADGKIRCNRNVITIL